MLIGYTFLILAETVLIRKPFSAGCRWKWKGILAAAGLCVGIEMCVGIEILQLVTSRGLCEFDDIIHNMIGAVIGIGIVMIGRKLLGESE